MFRKRTPAEGKEHDHICADIYETGWRTCQRRPGRPARISLGCLTNATNVYISSYARKHTKAHTQARECVHCQSDRKRHMTVY